MGKTDGSLGRRRNGVGINKIYKHNSRFGVHGIKKEFCAQKTYNIKCEL
jgi:hypothetical protein